MEGYRNGEMDIRSKNDKARGGSGMDRCPYIVITIQRGEVELCTAVHI